MSTAKTPDTARDVPAAQLRRDLLAKRLRAAVTELGTGAGPRAAGGIPRLAGAGPVPASRAQRELWVQEHYLDSLALFSAHQAMSLHGRLSVPDLREAMATVLARHDALRTTFTEAGEIVAGDGPVDPLEFRDLTGLGARHARREGLALLRAEIQAPFDLRHGPLVRVLLVAVGAAEHLLLLNLHHSVTDGVSFGIVIEELARSYTARLTTQSPMLRPDPLPYRDFASWQHGLLTGELLQEQREFWQKSLIGIEPILDLPTDRARPDKQSYRGAMASGRLTADQAEQVRSLAASNHTTPFVVLLTAFEVVLLRRSGQSSFGVGTLVSGRGQPELEGAVGLYASTVVLGVDAADEPDFSTLLHRQHERLIGALANSDVSFADIVDAVRPPRELGRNPLFQVLFQHEPQPEPQVELPGIRGELLHLDPGLAKVDLGLFTTDEGADGMALHLGYATDLYDAGTAENILAQFCRCLQDACQKSDRLVAELDLLPSGQVETVLRAWNDTATAYPHELCVHELFERWVDTDPAAVAIRSPEGVLSYRQLDEQANQLAQCLQAQGVITESPVGICIPHSPQLFAAILATMKAGAAYLPLDPSHPKQRLDHVLADSGASIVLCTAATEAAVAGAGRLAICLDTASLAEYPTTRPARAASASSENLVYIMYTSGSTGRPKGVLISHRGLLNYLWWAIEGYHLDREHGAPMLGSVAFDLSVPNFLLPWMAGKDVTVLPEDRSLTDLTGLLIEPGDFSLLKITPAHLDLLRGNLELRDHRLPVTSVSTYVVGADEIKAETVRSWAAIAPGARIINEYGPTETVVGCSVYEVPTDHDPRRKVSIGRPIANTTMYVLDSNLMPVPPGVIGELFIGGDGVARGYLNRPGLTAQKFLPDPFSDRPGARFYRTGDLSRFLPDGNLEFLGRQDHQVKIRGFRIELGDVEATLLRHPAISEAVAATHVAPGRDPVLYAYVVARPDCHPAPTELKAWLRHSLPEYLVPSSIRVVEQMPLSSGGKVDRRLLQPPGAGEFPVSAFEAPDGPVAGALAEIWSELLGVPRVSASDNFFDLGGDSILVIQLANRSRARGIALHPRSVYQHQSLQQLAAHVEAAPPAGTTEVSGDQRPPAQQVQPARLSPSQRWLVEHPAGLAPGHVAVELLTVATDTRFDDVSAALLALVAGHEALRIRQYQDPVGGWQQQSVPADRTRLLRPARLPPDPKLAGQQLVELAGQLSADIDIERGPLLHAALVTGEEDRRSLMVAIHHLATDGLSWQILLDDLATGISQARTGAPVELAPVPVSFSAWTAELARLAAEPVVVAELPRWLGQRSSGSLLTGQRLDRRQLAGLPRATYLDVCMLPPGARRRSSRIGELLLADFAQAMARWSGFSELTVEVSGHGRRHELSTLDTSRTVGWLAVRYPVTFQLPAGLYGAAASVPATRATLCRQLAVPNGGLGYGLLAQLSADPAVRSALAELPTPELAFNFLGRTDREPVTHHLLDGHGISGQPDQPDQVLSLVISQLDDRLLVNWNYLPDLHSEAAIADLAASYRGILAQ
ncbi:MAG: amino acid adenylation domain-containing protein [Jatrophihabitans sp.]